MFSLCQQFAPYVGQTVVRLADNRENPALLTTKSTNNTKVCTKTQKIKPIQES